MRFDRNEWKRARGAATNGLGFCVSPDSLLVLGVNAWNLN
jgi:hypothetical protein